MQVELKNNSTSDEQHSVFKNALQLLQEKGLVFQREGGSDKLYYVRDLQPSESYLFLPFPDVTISLLL